MLYTPRFSGNLSETKIKGIFWQAKRGRRIVCPRCRSRKISSTGSQRRRCRQCWYQFGLTTDTFLSRKRIDLRLWYEIIFGFATGLSARRLQRVLVVKDYRTIFDAYRIIRQSLVYQSSLGRRRFAGVTEVDESYYGGEFKNLRKEVREKLRRTGLAKRGRGAKLRKQPVFGIFKRNGEVYLELIADTKARTLEGIVQEKIGRPGRVYSDTHPGYDGLVGLGYLHRTINHGREEYVRGKVHINGIEGFWGLSKVNMQTYKGIRKKNWIYYLKEMEFRYNHRGLELEDLTLKIIDILCQKLSKSR